METQPGGGWVTQEEGNGQFQCITEQNCVSIITAPLLHLLVVRSLPLRLRPRRPHHGNHKSHISSSFLTDQGAVRSHAGTCTSVWRWLPLTHTHTQTHAHGGGQSPVLRLNSVKWPYDTEALPTDTDSGMAGCWRLNNKTPLIAFAWLAFFAI